MNSKIRLTITSVAQIASQSDFAGLAIIGGPNVLLDWIETQLGLRTQGAHRANRITEFANLLDRSSDAVFAASLAVDRWATAGELLDRFDDLTVSGWDANDDESLPRLVRDIARTVAGKKLEFPSDAVRLQRILLALDAGQTLPLRSPNPTNESSARNCETTW